MARIRFMAPMRGKSPWELPINRRLERRPPALEDCGYFAVTEMVVGADWTAVSRDVT